jgi:hypothetical protein
MLHKLPTEILILIFKYLDLNGIFNVIHINKKLYYNRNLKKNNIWKKFFNNHDINIIKLEYRYFDIIHKIKFIQNDLLCFQCLKPIINEYYIFICESCKINKYFNILIKLHLECCNINDNNSITYKKCCICNKQSLVVKCNLYS